MSEPISGSPWEWTPEQADEFFRMVGNHLQAQGENPDLATAIQHGAAAVVEGSEMNAEELATDLQVWISDEIFERRTSLVIKSWRSDHPGGGSLASLDAIDFGGGVYGVEEWDETSEGLPEILAIVDSLTSERVRDLIVDYLSAGVLPDGLAVPSMMSREDVARVLHSMLDSDNRFTSDWSQLAEMTGWSRPTDTEEGRAALLDHYLDQALRIE